MFLCRYVIIALSPQRKPCLTIITINFPATKMAPETMGAIYNHYARGAEAGREIHEQPGPRCGRKRRDSNLFRTMT